MSVFILTLLINFDKFFAIAKSMLILYSGSARMSNMPKKRDFSRKIIKLLTEKPVVSKSEIVERTSPETNSKYAVNRAIKGLAESGLIEYYYSSQDGYARLTKEGRKKAFSIKLEAENTLLNTSWDGFWRIVLLDLPEDRKSEREALRYLLKKAGFILVKNSVWISMYPFEHLFTNIKKDLGLSTELIILVTNQLDPATEEAFLKLVNL
jgi:DNA-binding transcriptional regulator PaaX